MRKTIVTFALLLTAIASAQIDVTPTQGLIIEPQPLAELNAIGNKPSGLIVNSGQTLLWWNGSAYIDILGGSGGIPDGDKGDIVVSNSGADWNIEAGAVTSSKLGADAVTSAALADNAVATSQIADDAVTGAKIDQETVTSVNVQNYSLGWQELDSESGAIPTDGHILSYTDTGSIFKWIPPPAGGGSLDPSADYSWTGRHRFGKSTYHYANSDVEIGVLGVDSMAIREYFSADNNVLKNLADPTDAQDAATKAYVDGNGGGFNTNADYDLTGRFIWRNGNPATFVDSDIEANVAVMDTIRVENYFILPTAPSDPARNVEGEIYFNSTNDELRKNNGTAWSSVSGGGSSGDMLKSVYDSDDNGNIDGAAYLALSNLYTNSNKYTSSTQFDDLIQVKPRATQNSGTTYSAIWVDDQKRWGLETADDSNIFAKFDFSNLTANRVYTFPDADGPIGSGGTTTNPTSFKSMPTGDYTLTTADRSTSTQTQRLHFNNPDDIDISEPVSPTQGMSFRPVQDGVGKVRTDWLVYVTTGSAPIYAQSTGLGKNIILEYDLANDKWYVSGGFESYDPTPPVTDAAQDPSLIADFEADDLAGTTGTVWSSAIGSFDINATGGSFDIRTRGDGSKEVSFNATVAATMASNYAALDFDPDNDDYTIILVMGDDAYSGDHLINKGGGNGDTDTQFGIDTNTTFPQGRFLVGGANMISDGDLQDQIVDGIFVIRSTAGTIEVFTENTRVGSTYSAGAFQSTETWSLASRISGTSQKGTMSVRRLLFYDTARPNTHLTEIYNQEK